MRKAEEIAREKTLFRKRDKSIRGAGKIPSHLMRTEMRIRLRNKRMRKGESKPNLGASVMKRRRERREVKLREAPKKSNAVSPFLPSSGRSLRFSAKVRMPIGIFTRKMERQPKRELRNPPRLGPIANPRATESALNPRALPLSLSGKIAVIIAGARDIVIPAPMACNPREITRKRKLGERAQIRDTKVKIRTPER